MSDARFLVGDVFDVMAGLEDDSFDLVLTSPPFLALRSYLPADHPDKGKEIGSEPSPAEVMDVPTNSVATSGLVSSSTFSRMSFTQLLCTSPARVTGFDGFRSPRNRSIRARLCS